MLEFFCAVSVVQYSTNQRCFISKPIPLESLPLSLRAAAACSGGSQPATHQTNGSEFDLRGECFSCVCFRVFAHTVILSYTNKSNYNIQNNRVRLTFMRVTMRDFHSSHNIHKQGRHKQKQSFVFRS